MSADTATFPQRQAAQEPNSPPAAMFGNGVPVIPTDPAKPAAPVAQPVTPPAPAAQPAVPAQTFDAYGNPLAPTPQPPIPPSTPPQPPVAAQEPLQPSTGATGIDYGQPHQATPAAVNPNLNTPPAPAAPPAPALPQGIDLNATLNPYQTNPAVGVTEQQIDSYITTLGGNPQTATAESRAMVRNQLTATANTTGTPYYGSPTGVVQPAPVTQAPAATPAGQPTAQPGSTTPNSDTNALQTQFDPVTQGIAAVVTNIDNGETGEAVKALTSVLAQVEQRAESKIQATYTKQQEDARAQDTDTHNIGVINQYATQELLSAATTAGDQALVQRVSHPNYVMTDADFVKVQQHISSLYNYASNNYILEDGKVTAEVLNRAKRDINPYSYEQQIRQDERLKATNALTRATPDPTTVGTPGATPGRHTESVGGNPAWFKPGMSQGDYYREFSKMTPEQLTSAQEFLNTMS